MNLITRYITQNPYFNDGRFLSGDDFTGFFLHSVGCAQPDPLVFIRGWDKPTHTNSGINGFIGADAGYITAPCLETPGRAKRMPHACRPANDHYIGFEMTEPKQLKYNAQGNAFTVAPEDLAAAKGHVRATYINAVELFAVLCIFHGKDPLQDGVILSHREGALRGIASHHGDPEFLWNGLKMGYTMNGFRADVKSKMEDLSMTEQQVKALIDASVEPLVEIVQLLTDTVEEQQEKIEALCTQIETRIGAALNEALGKKISHLDDAPRWMRPKLAELLEFGVINGGTPADVDPLDVNKRQGILEAVLMAMKASERYTDSLLLPMPQETDVEAE